MKLRECNLIIVSVLELEFWNDKRAFEEFEQNQRALPAEYEMDWISPPD